METLQVNQTGNGQLSIDALIGYQQAGYSVLRSAHVGNLSPYNLSLAAAGVPMLLVDHNITGVDKNYFPEQILTQTGNTQIAPLGMLSCRAQTEDGRFLDELHIAGIQAALPAAEGFTNSAYLRQNELVAGETARVMAQNFPEMFNRIVNPDGTTTKYPRATELIRRIGILQFNDDIRAEKSAVLLPNSIDIITNFVIEALASGFDRQYHLSGPDMVTYIDPLIPELQKMYELIKSSTSFGDRLPRSLTVQLVPAASARFATTSERQAELTDLLTQYDDAMVALAAIGRRRKQYFTDPANNNAQQKRAFIGENNQQQTTVKQALVDQAETVTGLFTPRHETGFVTQYDALAEGGLFVAPENRQWSFVQLTDTIKTLQQLRKNTQP